ncbi:MAG: hypothetical protein PHD06_03855 [Bacteroidales bacterium]|jgi:hypothetical protein|nr:hypothetical protein [Bacteroidales bacterium]MDD4384293.1 hypothetical protein [Bacteroidales bacterium]MDY0196740.1 hypothetical protein [Tenuifilaceae bacterium]
MKRKIYLLPLALLSTLILITWGCEKEKDEDVCEKFELTAKVQCGPATLCCPTDGGNCYIVNPDGADFYCDIKNATTSDPDGCAAAEAAYIAMFCSKGISNAEQEIVVKELRLHFRKLMDEARTYSVCN